MTCARTTEQGITEVMPCSDALDAVFRISE
jgi:hypothetical protein